MAIIKIYTTHYCPFCTAAKNFLKGKGVAFEEINVDDDDAKREWLLQTTGQRTVPQIFINDQSIGGFTDMRDLDNQGKLDTLLK